MKRSRVIIFLLVALAVLALLISVVWGHNFAVLNPAGTIAAQERTLILVAVGLSLIVIIPVFILTFVIAWKYREGNSQAVYTPIWDHDKKLEFTWWAIPCVIIGVLVIITWVSSHALDPYKTLAATNQPPLTVQVVALDWKWLFIYPQQHIASVNFLELPTNTPINFMVTADAPMNSFWIPQLSGQIYAMPGMSTQLHIMATQTGTYRGVSANISGDGFAGMHFNVQTVSPTDFQNWIHRTLHTPQTLDFAAYNHLANPSENNPVSFYRNPAPALYDSIVMKYMMPGFNFPSANP